MQKSNPPGTIFARRAQGHGRVKRNPCRGYLVDTILPERDSKTDTGRTPRPELLWWVVLVGGLCLLGTDSAEKDSIMTAILEALLGTL
tara:strand:- start:135 stop:398 length:264 start_codon:yes stop_codon:yes gene_type:complete